MHAIAGRKSRRRGLEVDIAHLHEESTMIRTRFIAILAVLGAAAIPIAAASAASPAAKVSLRRTGLGKILVNGSGHTLYAFTRDSRHTDRCMTTPGCSGIWPAFITHGAPHAGAGARRSLLSTIKLSDGTRQVTYAGHPLYTYTGDVGAGDTGYVGATQFGGTWAAVSGAGRLIK
jgi:predicted lipoprotein with Yx(FWY)xxD motif